MTARTVSLGGEFRVPRMGFGTLQLCGAGGWGSPPDRAEAVRVLRRAEELGVGLVDTADAYGPEVAEELVAEAFHPYPDHLVVATKGGMVRDGRGDWRANGRAEHLKNACEASMRRLRVEPIPLYQLHLVDPAVPFEESVGALAELRTEGKVKLIGLANVDAKQIGLAQAITEIASVQNCYNLWDWSSEPSLREVERDTLVFFPWFPLGGGRLAGTQGLLERIASKVGLTPAQIALAWLISRSPLIVPIPGTSTVPHLEENMRVLSLASNAELDGALRKLTAVSARLQEVDQQN